MRGASHAREIFEGLKAANIIYTPFLTKGQAGHVLSSHWACCIRKPRFASPRRDDAVSNLYGANGQTESMPHFKKVQRIDKAWYSFIPSCIVSSKCLFLVQPRNKRLQWPRAFPWLSSSDLLWSTDNRDTCFCCSYIQQKSHTPQPSTRPHLIHQAIPPRIEAHRGPLL